MKERPILFSGPMVRAILEGRKTQTRRIVKLGRDGMFICSRTSRYVTACEMKDDVGPWWHPYGGHPGEPLPQERIELACPYGVPGGRLWVRETFADTIGMGFDKRIHYAADTVKGSDGDEARKAYGVKWKPSIHMPRWASRITLEITGVRVDRLRDISEEDAKAEGISLVKRNYGSSFVYEKNGSFHGTAKLAFQALWESINGPSSWEQNPWVWVLEFKKPEGGQR